MKKRFHSNVPLPSPSIPEEIIAEILCLLPVKTILQLRCVSKAWKTLISDPTFVQKHLKNSSQYPHLLFTPPEPSYLLSSVKFSRVHLIVTDMAIIVTKYNFHGPMDSVKVVGTYKGLLCLLFRYTYHQNYWFCLWNPATRTLSEKLGISHDSDILYEYDSCGFTFGCDISTGTYKVVALSKVEVWEGNTVSRRYHQFRVWSLGENCWRTFRFGSSIPVCLIYSHTKRINNGVHLNGTVNWLALPKYIKKTYNYISSSIANAQQFVIVSFDLSTETCTQFLLPPGFDEVPRSPPILNVLMDCLCFSHDLKRSEFVIWQMKKFGVQNSWTFLFKISYFDIQMDNYLSHIDTHLLPLYLSNNGNTLILTNYEYDRVVLYNHREKSVRRIRIATELCCFSAMEYVESLVSTC